MRQGSPRDRVRSRPSCAPFLAEWQPLLSVQTESAATLTGLVFVAVSINLQKVLTSPGLPGRAAESLAQFLQVFFVSTTALIPRQTDAALATVIIAVALLCWALQSGLPVEVGARK